MRRENLGNARIRILIAGFALVMVAWLANAEDQAPAEENPVALLAGEHIRGVTGSAHDFSDPARGGGGACNACHVPHIQTLRPTTQPTTQPSFEMYRMPEQRQVFVPGRFTPGPSSLVCLGCHDGTVATSTIGSSHALLAGVREGFSVPEGTAWRDHPIGVAYARDRREYHNESFVRERGIRLPEGRIECISCHDPHNDAGIPGMLVMSNRRSALCLTCHIK